MVGGQESVALGLHQRRGISILRRDQQLIGGKRKIKCDVGIEGIDGVLTFSVEDGSDDVTDNGIIGECDKSVTDTLGDEDACA